MESAELLVEAVQPIQTYKNLYSYNWKNPVGEKWCVIH